MAYCINPSCKHRQNPDDVQKCLNCGTELLIDERFRLMKPLCSLDSRHNTEIFEAEENGKRKVMKVLKSSDPKAVELLERETLTLQLFAHPGIPRVVDDVISVTPNNSTLELHCLVMQFIEGQNLEEWVEENGKISQELAIGWLKQLVEIIDEVHRTGYFHRDIKPSNIILQPNGQLVLVDFGGVREVTNTYLAKVSGVGGNDIGLGGNYEITVLYSAGYTPLEQINGQAVPQSDFYALGRTFAYLVTGIGLTNLPTDQETTRLIWRNKAPQIEKPLADLLDDMMAPAPGKRPAAAKFILQRLDNLEIQSKIYRIVKTPIFKLSASILFILSLLGISYLSLPLVANHYLEQGKKAQKENRLSEAENQFQLAVKLKPNTRQAISQYYLEQADRRNIPLTDSRKYYELAIKYNPKNDVAYNNLALLCQQLHDIDCVEKNYQVLFKLKPNSWTGHYGLGSFYDNNGEYKLAIEQYQLAIESSEEAIYAISNLARLQVIEGKYDKAIALVVQGLKKTQETELQAALYKTWGWAELEQKNYVQAKKYLENSRQLYPRTDTYCLLAQVQEKNNAAQDARLSWEACLLAQSSLPEVQQWRQQFLDRTLGKVIPKSSP
ncbi:protein kinase [Nostoc sp. FACHB-87]|uniref:protein kinase domain-containing protein n=1 Tax=Nostocales TaxID=1161 RepID=UPI001684A6D5|nr:MULTISPECIES: protein kinase [Nostocales]MBD2303494.1 protein kinase [Nostoc sp. FACHB-190]MBD2458747.1 protein kinase [Nostoc sp. FACHB-87]MBD2479786.1 protein kinase [Anabaena sp. FACHB-83]MBD2492155.1 protein kinase [Aulosira sp. FACHB-615]